MEQDASESYPDGLPAFYQKQVLTNFKALDADTYVKKIEGQGRKVDCDTASYEVWSRIVKAYSETLITVPGDKLIALSGIAKRMKASVNNDIYVTGMGGSISKAHSSAE
jgi:hypothetical protein